VLESLDDSRSVWFGCDVDQCRLRGILDADAFDYVRVLGQETLLPRSERWRFRQTRMTHAMVIHGYKTGPDGDLLEFCVENSWGPKVNDGYFRMSPSWFREFVVECVVPRTAVSPELLELWLHDEPIVLPRWDPLGVLLRPTPS
jgi:bleomycin hydrolase